MNMKYIACSFIPTRIVGVNEFIHLVKFLAPTMRQGKFFSSSSVSIHPHSGIRLLRLFRLLYPSLRFIELLCVKEFESIHNLYPHSFHTCAP